ncbi:MAG: hypothetical protein EP338_14130 [Bacteroidetes bacterium]|nr:MAG: hypothetical protein EP338_14130 [Bacteroidota bacterium]
MPKFKSQIDLISNPNNTWSVDYSIFSPGSRYIQGTITQTQVNDYDPNTKELPGVLVEILMENIGPGNPTTVSGSFNLNAAMKIDDITPFLEVVFKAVENGEIKYKGGAITRGDL